MVINDRVKLIEFISEDGQVKQKVQLCQVFERQIFRYTFLPQVIYRLCVKNVYKGNKWDDTCLGEMEFCSASARGIVEQDEFFKNVK